MTRPAAFVLAIAVLTGCRSASLPPSEAAPASPVPSDVPLAPRVLDEKRGTHGLVQVVERDGLRLMLLDGAVQGAMPIPGGEPADPLAEIVASAKPDAKRVLLVGLGTGRTAATFLARGFAVEPVEIEPVVVEFARKHFGYRGPCEVADGLEVLRRPAARWDAIVIDAFTGGDDPGPLFQTNALRMAANRAPLVVARLSGRPFDRATLEAVQELGAHHAMLGDGVGGERQNLVLLGAHRPFAIRAPAGSPLHPVTLPTQGSPVRLPDAALTSRNATLTGYVIRMSENGAIALDLPHWEMGAVRYLLSGKPVADLAARLPAQTTFPTTGDISSDGETGGTLKDLLGGGDVKRADTRFSPLAATLEGTVRFRAAVDADLVFAGGMLRERTKPGPEPLLPYGGALYELEVERVTWTATLEEWRLASKAAGPSRVAALTALGKLDIAAARSALESFVATLAQGMGAAPISELPGIRQPARILGALGGVTGDAAAFERAAACDRAAHLDDIDWWRDELEPWRKALLACARTGYERAMSESASRAIAIGRLKLLLAVGDRHNPLSAKLAKEHPDIEMVDAPPPSPP